MRWTLWRCSMPRPHHRPPTKHMFSRFLLPPPSPAFCLRLLHHVFAAGTQPVQDPYATSSRSKTDEHAILPFYSSTVQDYAFQVAGYVGDATRRPAQPVRVQRCALCYCPCPSSLFHLLEQPPAHCCSPIPFDKFATDSFPTGPHATRPHSPGPSLVNVTLTYLLMEKRERLPVLSTYF